MRNILLFPDGNKQDFMYPSDREVVIGERIQIQMKDDTIRVLEIFHIQNTDKAIYYHLK